MMFKAGLLTELYAPDQQQEAARELTCFRQLARKYLMKARHRLLKFLACHGHIYHEGSHWPGRHFRWLGSLKFEDSLMRDVFDNYFTEM